MGNIGSRETEREQEERKCSNTNTFPAMKEPTRINENQDDMYAKLQREGRKLNDDIEKAIAGQLNVEELRSECVSPNLTFQNDPLKTTEDERNSRSAQRIEVLSEQESLVAALLRQIDDLTKDVNKCKEQARKKNPQYDYACTEREELVARIRHLETELEQVRDEKRQLLNRLSEIGAMRLCDNNPHITDLNDINRSLKLVEQFSSLYDDLWTDTFQLLEQMKMNERDSIHLLLKIVQTIFKICKEHARSKNIHLQDTILKYIGLNKKNRNETVVKEAMKIVREYRQKNLGYSLKKIYKYVQNKLQDDLPEAQVPQINSYTKECTRICWLMSIRDPQMFLSFDQVHNIGKVGSCPFDNTCFVFYTCTGLYVDFVVWPALFLYEGGPLLKKGVAQGTNDPSVVTNSATALKATENRKSKKGGEKPSLFRRFTGKIINGKQQGRQKEDPGKETENGAENSVQNIEQVNPAANDRSSSNYITQEANNIGLSSKINIFQKKNDSSDMTDVGS